MKKSRSTDSQIIAVLKQAQAGTPVRSCAASTASAATLYKWRSKFGGMEVSMAGRMKELEEENRRLKKDVRRGPTQHRPAQESAVKKMVRPSQRREVARQAAAGGRTSIWHACETFEVIETAIGTRPRPARRTPGSPTDPADQHVQGLRVWPLLPVSLQREGVWLEPQVGLPHLPGAGVEPADQAKKTEWRPMLRALLRGKEKGPAGRSASP